MIEEEVKNYLRTLVELRNFNRSIKHASRSNAQEEWEDSIPTYFMYHFFTFNSIYSVNWELTLENGNLFFWDIDENSEIGNIKSLIEYCIGKLNKLEIKDLCKECVKDLHKERIELALESIEEDKNGTGNIHAEVITKNGRVVYPIKFFKNDYRKILRFSTVGDFDFEEIKKVLVNVAIFVYKIRCNIFHGVKNIRVLCTNDENSKLYSNDRYKIKMYSSFLKAVNSCCINTLKKGITL